MPHQLRSWSQLCWTLPCFLMHKVTFLANTDNFRETFLRIFKSSEQWNSTRTDYRAKFSSLKIRTFDTVTWKGCTVVYIKHTRARVQVWALRALNFYNCTLSSKGSRKTLRSWCTCSQKHVRNKEKERNRQCLLVHSYLSQVLFLLPSLPASPSSSSGDNSEDFKKLPSQKLPIYQGKHK